MLNLSPPNDDLLDQRQTAWLVVFLIALAMLGRFVSVGELGNFTPVGAVALFAGCYLRDRRLAYLVPMSAMVLSDAVLGFHSLIPVTYACFMLCVFLGQSLRTRLSGARLLQFALLNSAVFFVITNLAVWAEGTLYARTGAGLLQCFTMAIPFFKNDLLGTLMYSALLFGGFQWVQQTAAKRISVRTDRG
jgi:hypothetical protein